MPQWEVNKRLVFPSERIFINKTHIVILKAKQKDHGTYACYGTYSNGEYFKSIAMLNVISKLSCCGYTLVRVLHCSIDTVALWVLVTNVDQ